MKININKLLQVADCQQCTAGYYCVPEGLASPAGECPGGYYCPLGTAEPYSYPCPQGFYRNGASAESFQDCTACISGYYCPSEGLADPIECPAGYFCVAGSLWYEPCPLGTYSNTTGLRRSTDCVPCPGGYVNQPIVTVCDMELFCFRKSIRNIYFYVLHSFQSLL